MNPIQILGMKYYQIHNMVEDFLFPEKDYHHNSSKDLLL